MKTYLKEIRNARGLTQAELADMLEVKLPTYRTWERGTSTMNLEQAYNCAIALGCTLNDLVGMEARPSYADPRQVSLNGHFESFNETGKDELSRMADRMSHDPSIRIEKDWREDDRIQTAMGA